jgi:kumamolisin
MPNKFVSVATLIFTLASSLVLESRAQNSHDTEIAAAVMLSSDTQDLGRRDPGAMVDILVNLRLNHEQELQQLTEQQSDRQSPNYHRYLTPAEFADRFGPTADQVKKVAASLTTAGFQVTGVADNRLLIYASAPSVTVENYFRTEIHNVNQGTYGERYVNFLPALAPAELESSVEAVVLDNLIFGLATSEQVEPLALGAPYRGPKDGIGPATIATAFNFPVQGGYDGTGRTAAIIIASDVRDTDLKTYWDYFKIIRTGTVTREAVGKGKVGKYTSSELEATLDTETITGLAPGANVIIYITAELNHQEADVAANQIDSDDTAEVVNMSFGHPELKDPTFTNVVTVGNAEGITFVASGGDYGSDHGVVLTPAAQPRVLAVGGTELTANKVNGNFESQVAWPHSGGGVSKIFRIPTYQVGVSGLASTKERNLPDIAFPAFDDARYVKGAWDTVAGTSWSSPTYVALQLEINQLQGSRFGWVNPNIYQVFSAHAYSDFYDVTKGSNGEYKAKPGYDNVSGIGSPKGLELANDL